MRRLAPILVVLASLAGALPAAAQAGVCGTADARHDDALDAAAAAILVSGEEPTAVAIERAVRAAGSDLTAVRALDVRDDDDAREAEWLASVREEGGGAALCGRAVRAGRALVLAAVRRGRLTIEGSRIDVELAAGLSDAHVWVEDADGEIVALAVDGTRDTLELPAGLSLPARVQLVARDARGPRPVAVRSVGGELATRHTARADLPLVERVTAARRDGGAHALRASRVLDRVAAAHAERVCREGRVGHQLEEGGDPTARLAAEGVRARHVGEVVARGADEAAAFDALLASPSHRAALVDRRFTDAGVGAASDDRGRRCVVVLLAAWPRVVGH